MSEKNQSPTKIFKPFSKSDEKGFALLEILVAVSIFAVGMLAVIVMQTTTVKSNTFSSGLSRAVRDCNQAQLEKLLALPYNDPNLVQNNYGPFTNGIYSTSYSVTDNTPFTGAKTVAVTTTWGDIHGAHTTTMAFVKDSIL